MRRLSASMVSLTAVILLSACGSTDFRASRDGARPAAAAKGGSNVVAPYMQNRRVVSREALQRFELANQAISRQEWPAAIAELEWLVENQPDLSGPQLNLALVYQNMNELEKAETYYRQALQSNPDNLAAYNQYAIFLRQQGRFEDAEKAYLLALEKWEPHGQTHRNIGVLYDLYMGDQAQALQHFHRYQTLSETEDRVVASWIADLNRQLVTLARGE
jgi:Tfp pilus assembly protein PilF